MFSYTIVLCLKHVYIHRKHTLSSSFSANDHVLCPFICQLKPLNNNWLFISFGADGLFQIFWQSGSHSWPFSPYRPLNGYSPISPAKPGPNTRSLLKASDSGLSIVEKRCSLKNINRDSFVSNKYKSETVFNTGLHDYY